MRFNGTSARLSLRSAAFLIPPLAFLSIYGPAVGRGFIADDFAWILESRAATLAQAVSLFGRNRGFYRPLVALSFAADYRLFGNQPLGYGLTNLLLCLSCAAAIVILLRGLDLPRGAAAFGSAVWLLNFHGINMAVLWISGRTALLLVLFSVSGALALVRGRVWWCLCCLALALFSKEEAVVLPAILLAWAAILPRFEPRLGSIQTAALVVGTLGLLGVYGWLRIHSGAMTASTAPGFYRFTFAPSAVLVNAAHYADRACTFATAAAVLAWAILRPLSRAVAVRWRIIFSGAAWLIGGYAITVFLPVRSSVYACFPSVGSCVIAAEVCYSRWQCASEPARRRALWAIVLIPLVCAPVYAARNHRWTDLARFSTASLEVLARTTAGLPDRSGVLLIDDRSRRVNLQSAFGTLINDAVELKVGRRFDVWVEPPLGAFTSAGLTPLCAGCERLRLTMRDGRLTR